MRLGELPACPKLEGADAPAKRPIARPTTSSLSNISKDLGVSPPIRSPDVKKMKTGGEPEHEPNGEGSSDDEASGSDTSSVCPTNLSSKFDEASDAFKTPATKEVDRLMVPRISSLLLFLCFLQVCHKVSQ